MWRLPRDRANRKQEEYTMIVIFIRAAIIAAIIGSILTAINQYDWIVGRGSLQLLPLILVFLLPLAVVIVGQIVGVRQARIDVTAHKATVSSEGFFATMVRHGIPARAVVIGLVFGSLNAIIVLTNAHLRSGDLAAVPLVPLAQAYVLPFLFGVLSQTFSYRRYRSKSSRFDITKGEDSMPSITDR
jgi:hypothetical protein